MGTYVIKQGNKIKIRVTKDIKTIEYEIKYLNNKLNLLKQTL